MLPQVATFGWCLPRWGAFHTLSCEPTQGRLCTQCLATEDQVRRLLYCTGLRYSLALWLDLRPLTPWDSLIFLVQVPDSYPSGVNEVCTAQVRIPHGKGLTVLSAPYLGMHGNPLPLIVHHPPNDSKYFQYIIMHRNGEYPILVGWGCLILGGEGYSFIPGSCMYVTISGLSTVWPTALTFHNTPPPRSSTIGGRIVETICAGKRHRIPATAFV